MTDPQQPPVDEWDYVPPRRAVMSMAPPPPSVRDRVRGAISSGIDTLAGQIPGLGPQPGTGAAVMGAVDSAAGMLASQVPGGPSYVDPMADKDAARAKTRAQATAAVNLYHSGEANGPRVHKAPPPPATQPLPKAGTGPKLSMTEAQEHQSRTVPVRTTDGRVVWSDPETAMAYGRAGGTPLDRGEALALSGNREDKNSQYQGATVASGSEGTAIFRPSMKVQLPRSRPSRAPYSSQVENLVGSMPEVDVNAPGSRWNFTGGIEEGGGPRQGTRTLSGIEQASSRNAFLQQRADTERASELEQAMSERRLKEANIDPLEALRIQAQGRYGGEAAKVALDLEGRKAAIADYTNTQQQIEAARGELAKAQPGSPLEARLKEYIDQLTQEARERANIIMGHILTQPRPDLLTALSGLATGAVAPGASTPTGGR